MKERSGPDNPFLAARYAIADLEGRPDKYTEIEKHVIEAIGKNPPSALLQVLQDQADLYTARGYEYAKLDTETTKQRTARQAMVMRRIAHNEETIKGYKEQDRNMFFLTEVIYGLESSEYRRLDVPNAHRLASFHVGKTLRSCFDHYSQQEGQTKSGTKVNEIFTREPTVGTSGDSIATQETQTGATVLPFRRKNGKIK